MGTPGIYVHIPFCLKRCDYCDFTTFADRDDAIPAYVAGLRHHIQLTGEGLATTSGGMFGSVFVGGGTPTYLPPADLVSVIRAVAGSLDVAADAEWTVEANPETVTTDMAAALVESGVNRVSLGAQSFDDRVLAVLGRWHDPASVIRAIDHLREAGISRLSVDLIYGTPGETDRSWSDTLDRAVDLGVSHISAYALTVEPNTPYAARLRENPALRPDEDIQAARMAVAEDRLDRAGMRRYEISNWAQPGHESRHNLTYWRGNDWLAFGSGAHGAWEGRRYWLVRDPEKYARLVGDGVEPLGGEEFPDGDAVRLERLMMGLRIVEGVAMADVQPLDPTVVSRLIANGLLTLRGGDHLALTPAALPVADAVIRELA